MKKSKCPKKSKYPVFTLADTELELVMTLLVGDDISDINDAARAAARSTAASAARDKANAAYTAYVAADAAAYAAEAAAYVREETEMESRRALIKRIFNETDLD